MVQADASRLIALSGQLVSRGLFLKIVGRHAGEVLRLKRLKEGSARPDERASLKLVQGAAMLSKVPMGWIIWRLARSSMGKAELVEQIDCFVETPTGTVHSTRPPTRGH